MANKEVKEEVAEEVMVDTPHVVQHLDIDPNDPRNRPVAQALPSLNDEDQN